MKKILASLILSIILIPGIVSAQTLKVLASDILYYQSNNQITLIGGNENVIVGVVAASSDFQNPVGWITLHATPDAAIDWNGYTVTDLSGQHVAELSKMSPGPYKIIAVSKNSEGNYCIVSKTEECNVGLSEPFIIKDPIKNNKLLSENTANVASHNFIANLFYVIGDIFNEVF